MRYQETQELPVVEPEDLPVIPDEALKAKRSRGGKLTKKIEAIDKGREASSKTQKGVSDALTMFA